MGASGPTSPMGDGAIGAWGDLGVPPPPHIQLSDTASVKAWSATRTHQLKFKGDGGERLAARVGRRERGVVTVGATPVAVEFAPLHVTTYSVRECQVARSALAARYIQQYAHMW